MQYTACYKSPLGDMLLAADEAGLTGLWFADQKHFAARLEPGAQQKELPVFADARRWLEAYFAGRQPGFTPPLHLIGTPFQLLVWQQLLAIPYGHTVTYGALAGAAAAQLGRQYMSAQAVGGAVGRNPVSVIVPCHRVLGAGGSLVGYAGGLDKKQALLRLEGVVNSR